MSCNGCGERFASVQAFDLHRGGKWGAHEAGWTGWLQRWCIPPEQVVVGKRQEKPLRERPDGAWEHGPNVDAARAHFGS